MRRRRDFPRVRPAIITFRISTRALSCFYVLIPPFILKSLVASHDTYCLVCVVDILLYSEARPKANVHMMRIGRTELKMVSTKGKCAYSFNEL